MTARTGRTTRMLAEAARLAADGRYVFVVGQSEREAERLHDEFVGAHGGQPTNRKVLKVYYETGQVSFVPPYELRWEDLRFPWAHPDCVVLVDHFAIEEEFASVLAMLHRYDESERPTVSEPAGRESEL